LGAKPKTRRGVNTLGRNVLVYPNNALYLNDTWKEKLHLKGGKRRTLRKSQRKRNL
jgi:hypothetical protein